MLSPVICELGWGPIEWVYGRYPASHRFIETVGYPRYFAREHGVYKFLGVEEMIDSYDAWWSAKGWNATNRTRAISRTLKD